MAYYHYFFHVVALILIGTLLFLLIFVCLIRFGIWATSSSWLIFGFLIWFRVVEVLLNLEFWGLPGRIFNVRQSKRLLGLIASGEVVARIVGGFSVPLLVAQAQQLFASVPGEVERLMPVFKEWARAQLGPRFDEVSVAIEQALTSSSRFSLRARPRSPRSWRW